jgi:hypothetical protein
MWRAHATPLRLRARAVRGLTEVAVLALALAVRVLPAIVQATVPQLLPALCETLRTENGVLADAATEAVAEFLPSSVGPAHRPPRAVTPALLEVTRALVPPPSPEQSRPEAKRLTEDGLLRWQALTQRVTIRWHRGSGWTSGRSG